MIAIHPILTPPQYFSNVIFSTVDAQNNQENSKVKVKPKVKIDKISNTFEKLSYYINMTNLPNEYVLQSNLY